jgi:hypothetical protein
MGDTAPYRSDTEPAPPRFRPAPGRILLSVILIAVGSAWLLDAIGVIEVSWGALLPSALIVVGLALIAGARSGRHGGLIALGVVLTVLLGLASSLNVPLTAGVGNRTYTPGTTEDLPSRYRLAFGSLEVDLRGMQISAPVVRVEAQVGFGQLVVRVPNGVALEVHGRVSGGQFVVLGEERNGLNVEDTVRVAGAGAQATLVLDLSAGFGSVKVDR